MNLYKDIIMNTSNHNFMFFCYAKAKCDCMSWAWEFESPIKFVLCGTYFGGNYGSMTLARLLQSTKTKFDNSVILLNKI